MSKVRRVELEAGKKERQVQQMQRAYLGLRLDGSGGHAILEVDDLCFLT